MNLPDIPLLNVLRERMTWLNARQGVLSQNVANADIPGYAARDLKPFDFQDALKHSTQSAAGQLAVTNPLHISLPADSGSSYEDAQSDDVAAGSAGNTASNEEEMMKVAETQAQYQAATNLYAKAVSMMRTAIDKSGS
jgi:flagellar basal-body rod protein FlgB